MLLEALRLPPARELAPALYIITAFGFFFLSFPVVGENFKPEKETSIQTM